MKINIIKSKTRKRSIQISVNKDKQITVKAPFKTSDKEIEKFLANHKDWIEKTLKKIPDTPKKDFIVGEKFLLMGQEYTFIGTYPLSKSPYKSKQKKYVMMDNTRAILFSNQTLESKEIRDEFVKFYKKFGKEYSQIKSKEFADLINKSFNRISIKDVTTRWGSCSTKNNLNYNYKLFMAPKEVVDYVIAHEVAHLKERNHSKNFWSLVEQIYPTYKIHRRWLKKNGDSLNL